jgi:hypothetical protein
LIASLIVNFTAPFFFFEFFGSRPKAEVYVVDDGSFNAAMARYLQLIQQVRTISKLLQDILRHIHHVDNMFRACTERKHDVLIDALVVLRQYSRPRNSLFFESMASVFLL